MWISRGIWPNRLRWNKIGLPKNRFDSLQAQGALAFLTRFLQDVLLQDKAAEMIWLRCRFAKSPGPAKPGDTNEGPALHCISLA